MILQTLLKSIALMPPQSGNTQVRARIYDAAHDEYVELDIVRAEVNSLGQFQLTLVEA